MVKLELSVADVLRCRFAISPVSEVIVVARAIVQPAARAAHSAWLHQHRAARFSGSLTRMTSGRCSR